jgi:hypothetical protein
VVLYIKVVFVSSKIVRFTGVPCDALGSVQTSHVNESPTVKLGGEKEVNNAGALSGTLKPSAFCTGIIEIVRIDTHNIKINRIEVFLINTIFAILCSKLKYFRL